MPDRTTTLPDSRANGYTPSYLAATIAVGLVFTLYLLTLAPSVAMWDTGEYMASVKVNFPSIAGLVSGLALITSAWPMSRDRSHRC
ncbi:MAG TPA: hypothetical protein VGG76_00925 [Gemmatimonadaceae bacterium]